MPQYFDVGAQHCQAGEAGRNRRAPGSAGTGVGVHDERRAIGAFDFGGDLIGGHRPMAHAPSGRRVVVVADEVHPVDGYAHHLRDALVVPMGLKLLNEVRPALGGVVEVTEHPADLLHHGALLVRQAVVERHRPQNLQMVEELARLAVDLVDPLHGEQTPVGGQRRTQVVVVLADIGAGDALGGQGQHLGAPWMSRVRRGVGQHVVEPHA